MKLIFVHGSGGGSVVWEEQIAHFPNAEAINLPGHPEGEACDTIEAYVQYLSHYLDQQEDSGVVLVGHSLGSAVVMQSALMKHSALRGMVLIGAGARLKVLPALLDSLSQAQENGAAIPASVLSMNQRIALPLREKIDACVYDNGPATLLSDLRACDKFDVMTELSSVTLPTLIIVGAQDQMTPPKYAQFLQVAIAGSSLVVIEDASHMVFAEKAELVNECIAEFLLDLK